MSYVGRWFLAFLLTQLLEAPLYFVALRERRRAARLALALAPSGLTHPCVWFVGPTLVYEGLQLPAGWHWPAHLLLAESFAVLLEAAFLHAVGLRQALRWSLAANGTSFLLGLFVYERLGW